MSPRQTTQTAKQFFFFRKGEHQIQMHSSWLQRCVSSSLLLSSHTQPLVPQSAARIAWLHQAPVLDQYSRLRNALEGNIINNMPNYI